MAGNPFRRGHAALRTICVGWLTARTAMVIVGAVSLWHALAAGAPDRPGVR